MREIRIGRENASQRFDKFLRRYLPEAGSSFLYKQLRKKNITLNGGKAEGKETLAEGDVVRIWFSEETLEKFSGKGQREDLRQQETKAAGGRIKKAGTPALTKEMIVYEDDNVLLINKPAGILSQKASRDDVSLVEMLQAYLTEKGELTEEKRKFYAPSVVNRIDRNTSGLVLAAKNLAAARELSQILRDRTLQKFYYALVNGEVREAAHVKAWLVKDHAKNQVRVSDHPVPDADPIETVYEPLVSAGRYTLLRVELLTGKTHQIRSHLSFIGHSLVGDVKYGYKSTNQETRECTGLSRQFLHAEKVIFPEMKGVLKSLSGLCFRAPLPRDLRKTLDVLGIRL